LKYKLLDTNYVIGERIRVLREELGYTREKFAEILDVSISTLANIELGRTQISYIVLSNLYNVFGISSDDILYGTKKTDTIQKKINHIVSNLSTNKLKYIYRMISLYVSLHK